MKKLITFLFSVLLTFSLSAQQFGGKVGLNIAAVGNSEGNGPEDGRMGIQLGALVMFELSDVIEMRTGLIYNQKGAAEVDFLDLGEDLIYALDYLEVPMDFAFKLGDGGFALSAGPYFGFLMSSKVHYDGESEDIEDMNGMDMGLNLGMSFLINESILIDVRYGMGLMDITDDDLGDDVDVNGALQFSFGYVFGG